MESQRLHDLVAVGRSGGELELELVRAGRELTRAR